MDTAISQSYDVIVIGAGAMGAAACWHLARRGARVLGLEQNGVPNSLGSSHGYTRMTRTSYYEHPDYVPLIRRANELWRDLERDSGQSVLHLDGALYMGAPDGELISGSRRSADAHGITYSMLSHDEMRFRYPQFRLPEHYVGMREEEAGYLRPELGVAMLAEQAMRRGAEIHGCERVLGWDEERSGISVRTDQGRYRANHLIVTAGAWTGKLMREIGVRLKVTRQALGWVWPPRTSEFEPDKFPVFAIGHADGSLHYGFPMLPDNPGLKVASHACGTAADPETLERGARPGDAESFLPFLGEFIPEAVGPVVAIRICMYVNSPDGHFIVDRLPGAERVTVACGFSGHGFKFTPVIGEVLADLALAGRTGLPVGFLGLARFDEEKKLL